MSKIDALKTIWTEVYNQDLDTESIIHKHFNDDYTQCINGVSLNKAEYIKHVISQKQLMNINHIEYIEYLESGNKLFALYKATGMNTDGQQIEGEVISYIEFYNEKISRIHGQVHLLKGNFSDVDM